MSFRNEVHSRFFQELCIDTNIEYQFSERDFPGMNDPRYIHEPILLVGSNDTVDNPPTMTEPTLLDRFEYLRQKSSGCRLPVAMTEEDIISFIDSGELEQHVCMLQQRDNKPQSSSNDSTGTHEYSTATGDRHVEFSDYENVLFDTEQEYNPAHAFCPDIDCDNVDCPTNMSNAAYMQNSKSSSLTLNLVKEEFSCSILNTPIKETISVDKNNELCQAHHASSLSELQKSYNSVKVYQEEEYADGTSGGIRVQKRKRNCFDENIKDLKRRRLCHLNLREQMDITFMNEHDSLRWS